MAQKPYLTEDHFSGGRPKGVCGVVMPHGVLFRGSGDGRIREGMLKADLFEAIIGLPENLFAGAVNRPGFTGGWFVQ